uniref:Phospholipase B1, membrane-associated n=1 Tax=Amphiprion ocellaris TaxID=80972 RepID=A0AAQ5ZM89_AMPOC
MCNLDLSFVSLKENPLSDLDQLANQLWTNLVSILKSESHITVKGTIMGTEIPCADRSPSPTIPTSVHELRPGDIKVVAAVGDSLTAANGVGAKVDNLLLVMNEYRGLSWSIGGDKNITTVTTLPNILREFNPSVTGFSTGVCGEDNPAAFLNQAVPGAKSGNMVQQVRVLVDKMKTDSRIDFHNDWKVITMFIGGNDICDYCTDSVSTSFFPQIFTVVSYFVLTLDLRFDYFYTTVVCVRISICYFYIWMYTKVAFYASIFFMSGTYFSPQVFFSARNVAIRIQEALDILHKEVPRAIVNLVDMLNILPLRDLHSDKTLGCPTWFVSLICPCILKPKEGSFELQQASRFNRAYQLAMRQLIDSGIYDTHDNFTVVLQPFFREVFLPMAEDGRPDRSYFTPDCFHLSQKAHTLMARALWNNMVGFANPFLRTSVNSNYTFPGPPPTPPPFNWGSDFFCVNTAPSNSVPTSAHRVRPADIKVVGAVGDSLTAAFGARATNLLQLLTEYRGVSWSIGGDDSLEIVTTLPNILKKFNPGIKGTSKGTGKAETGFNMAVSGAKISGIPGQIRHMIDTMKNDATVDFQNDWKLVTIFIGGNDLCQYCNDRVSCFKKSSQEAQVDPMDERHFQSIPPRRKRISCCSRVAKHPLCCCAIPRVELIYFCQVKTERLVYSGRYDGREDFAAVVQPYFRNTIVPLTDGKPDDSYFSQDCFHFSERGHAEMAIHLWNNMLEPVGEKQSYNIFTNARDRIKCPTEHPYIFTRVNSLPESTTTPKPVPAWLAAVLAVVGLLIGCAATWLLLSCIAKRKSKKMKLATVEMKATEF